MIAFSDGMSEYVRNWLIGIGSGPLALPSRIRESLYQASQLSWLDGTLK